MARGLPAVWSGLLATPFLIGGGGLYVSTGPQEIPLGITLSSAEAQYIAFSAMGFGLFVLLVGLYVHSVSPEQVRLLNDEEIVEQVHPAQKVAATKIVLSLPIISTGLYLLLYTVVPYVYPTVCLFVGLALLSLGLKTYWANTLTIYYLTNRRLISEYRFLRLDRKEIPLDKVRGVQERKSLSETLVGLGNVRVASGGGGGAVEVIARNIAESAQFVSAIRRFT